MTTCRANSLRPRHAHEDVAIVSSLTQTKRFYPGEAVTRAKCIRFHDPSAKTIFTCLLTARGSPNPESRSKFVLAFVFRTITTTRSLPSCPQPFPSEDQKGRFLEF